MASRVMITIFCMLFGAAISGAQTLIISVNLESNGYQTGLHQLGVNPLASNGIDGYDVPEPPAEPGSRLSAAFVMDEDTGEVPNRWRADIRNLYAMEDNWERWLLLVMTDMVGEACTISFDFVDGSEFPAQLHVITDPEHSYNVLVPGSIECVLTQPAKLMVMGLSLAWAVNNSDATWTHIKNLYR